MPYLYTGRGLAGTVQDQITAAAPGYGVPSALALAVAQRESGFNQSARGSKGEVGVFQLMPATAAGLGVDPTDLGQNIAGGLSYLGSLYRQFGDWNLALEAYNGGPGNVQRGTVSPAAENYASAVLASAGMYADTGETPPADSAGSAAPPPADYPAGASTGLDLASVPPLVWGGVAAAAALVLVAASR